MIFLSGYTFQSGSINTITISLEKAVFLFTYFFSIISYSIVQNLATIQDVVMLIIFTLLSIVFLFFFIVLLRIESTQYELQTIAFKSFEKKNPILVDQAYFKYIYNNHSELFKTKNEKTTIKDILEQIQQKQEQFPVSLKKRIIAALILSYTQLITKFLYLPLLLLFVLIFIDAQ